MVWLRSRFFTLVMGLALAGLIGKPAHAAMYWMDGESASAAPNPSFTPASPIGSGSEVLSTAVLRLEDVFTTPGADFDMPVVLLRDPNVPTETPVVATGVQFDLDLNGVSGADSSETFITLDNAIAAGFNLTYDQAPFHGPNVIRVLITPQDALSEIPIDQDGVVVAHLHFEGEEGAQSVGGYVNPLSVIITGEDAETLGDVGVPGFIIFTLPGDVNFDSFVDIRDVVRMVRFILDNPELEPAVRAAADVNQDGNINVADVIGIVNLILGRPIDFGVPVKVTSNPVAVNLGAVALRPDGQTVVPVLLNAADMVAGAHATFTFDPKAMSVGTPFVEGNPGHLLIDSKVTEDGKLQVVVISLSMDKGLNTGATPTLLIPVTLLDDRNAVIRLTELTLANPNAQVMPISFGATEQSFTKGVLLPTAFALKNAAPNPFNPSTAISYEVPQQAHITLTVYNLLGQEVIRLVDQVQAPGRYQITWNAVNAAGRPVSSGVYLYRMISSTGFSDTKRITLLK